MRLISAARLDFFFEQILGTDNIKAEGKVELAMNFFSKSDYKAEEILIVGDTLHDLEIGNKIGCMTILSSMGHNSKSFLAGFHDHLIDDLQEVLDEEDLIKLGGLDKYMKSSVTEVLGDYEEDEDEDYEDMY